MTATAPVRGLRHIGLAVPNYDETVDFYRDVWGLQLVQRDDQIAFFASAGDPQPYLIRIRKAAKKRLDLIAFESPSREAVDALADRLAKEGVRIDRAPTSLTTPGGGYGLRFFDLDGRLIEVSADVALKTAQAPAAREGRPLGLSHIVLNSTNVKATEEFYERFLGMRVSDWLEELMCFLRADEKHHILAISQAPHVALNHVAFEVGSIDAQMRGTGRLLKSGRKLIWGPGRHGAGDNTFSYFQDPAGNVIEYTAELETIPDEATWKVRRFSTTDTAQDQWGTGGLVTDAMIPAMFNDPDPGVGQSCPI